MQQNGMILIKIPSPALRHWVRVVMNMCDYISEIHEK